MCEEGDSTSQHVYHQLGKQTHRDDAAPCAGHTHTLAHKHAQTQRHTPLYHSSVKHLNVMMLQGVLRVSMIMAAASLMMTMMMTMVHAPAPVFLKLG